MAIIARYLFPGRPGVTRIVSYAHRYKASAPYDAILSINRPTAASAPTRKMIICASRMLCLHRVGSRRSPPPKKSRRPTWGTAAAEVVALAAHSSTPRDAERDRAVTPPADDDRPAVITTTTSRKRLRAEHDHDDQADHGDRHQDIRALLEHAKWGRGPSR
jgi:hypothetical protein